MAATTDSARFTFAVKEFPQQLGFWYIMLEPDAGGLKTLPDGFLSLVMREGKDHREAVERLAAMLNAMVDTLSFTDTRGSDDACHVENIPRNLPKL